MFSAYRLAILIPILCTVGLLAFQGLPAQDIHLSQFFNTPLQRNPALAGIFTGDVRVQTVYRNQWSSVAYPYQTHSLNAEYKFPVGQGDDYMTVGASAFYDRAGIQNLKTLQIMPALNFHKSLSGERSTYLSGGFMAGFVSRQFNGQQLTFDNQYNGHYYDPSLATGEQFTGLNKTFFDAAVGLSFNSEFANDAVYYLGTSLWHFNKPSAGFLNDNIALDPKWQFNAGLKLPLNELTRITVEGNHLIQGNFQQTIVGAVLLFDVGGEDHDNSSSISGITLGAGALVRFNDAIIPYVQFTYNNLDIGISYDVNTSSLKTASQGQGGFEFSLSYRAFTANHDYRLNGLRCPRF